MSFEESLIMVSSLFPNIQQEHEDGNFHKIRTSLSRLSVCTTSVHNNNEEEEPIKIQTEFMSESFDADADGEVSDDNGGRRGKENVQESDSDNFYSLPATQSRRRKKVQVSDEVDGDDGKKCNLRRQRRVIKEKKKSKNKKEVDGGGSDGVGLTVLTRAKGGEKSLRMGLEEVKACRDLGFDLEVPGRISVSTGSNFDTQTSSSGGNSPIATWRISSPGDDPKEVKARLKVWAQAVVLASTSRQAK